MYGAFECCDLAWIEADSLEELVPALEQPPGGVEEASAPAVADTTRFDRTSTSTTFRADWSGLTPLAWDTATELPGDLLVKVERMSMAQALKARSPLLDDDVCLRRALPAEVKVEVVLA